ncbi:MAG: PLP-dependent aminotransferase family protein [Anaerolineaceae bacterium]|nr:PLP-dependent aminotransferase family protein [Anaerolineaceae bacterium]
MKQIFPIALIQLDRENETPLYQQIANGLRESILNNMIPPGTKLPSHRDLTQMLDVSRNTVVNAIDQLISEGYITARVGAGSFVSNALPDDFLISTKHSKFFTKNKGTIAPLSSRGKQLVKNYNPRWHLPKHDNHNLFRNGLPERKSFPFPIWEKISKKYLFYQSEKIFDFNPDPAGYIPLRKNLAEYLQIARAVKCDENQIMMITGIEQAIYLAARLLTNPGDNVWVEEPGFPGAARAFQAAGNQIIPIPVDDNGFDIEYAIQKAPDAKIVYVSPSHQFPIGSTLSLKRRLALLKWAESNDAWIIEDDYDSEYRYNERPLPALQGLDKTGRVIYCGTFNLTLFPGIRLDYIVLPENLFPHFLAARTILDIHIPMLNQAIISDFIEEGHFIRHIRKMRKIYARRRDVLLQAIKDHPTELLSAGQANCGVYICGFLKPHISDEMVFEFAGNHGIEVLPLSRFYIGEKPEMGLVLGYASCEPQQIQWGISKIIDILESLEKP